MCGLLSVKNCHVKVSKLTLRIHITVAVMTDELIVGCEKFPQYARCFYDKKRVNFMLSYCIKPQTTMCLASSSCLQQEIFGGRNFHGKKFCKLVFDCENRENFCVAKFSRYTATMPRQPSNKLPEYSQMVKVLLAVW